MNSLIFGIIVLIALFFFFQMIFPFPLGLVLWMIPLGLVIWYEKKNLKGQKIQYSTICEEIQLMRKKDNKMNEALRKLEKKYIEEKNFKKRIPRKKKRI